jgi:hypothetical protein
VAAYEPGGSANLWQLREAAGLDAFLAAAKPGDTSPIFRGYGGPVIVRLTKDLPAHTAPFDEVKEKVRKDAALSRGLTQASEMARDVRERVKEATAPGMREAAAQFTVHTKQAHAIAAHETRYLTRRDAMSDNSVARVFALRFGEITEPPIVTGERAPSCLLAVLSGSREVPPGAQLVEATEQVVRSERLQRLIEAALRDLQRTTPLDEPITPRAPAPPPGPDFDY